MRVLVLGATGMAGSSIYALLDKNPDFEVHGTVRSELDASMSSIYKAKNIHQVTDIISEQNLRAFLNKIKPNVVINCIGIIKQITNTDTKALISVNSLFLIFSLRWGLKLVHELFILALIVSFPALRVFILRWTSLMRRTFMVRARKWGRSILAHPKNLYYWSRYQAQ